MVINEGVCRFAARFLETCLRGACNSNPGTARGGDPTKVPLHLIDLQSAGFNDWDPRLLKVVHHKQIPNLGTVEWATLSYARRQTTPRKMQLYINEGVILEAIYESALEDAIRIVEELGIRYLWVDLLCPYWDPYDDAGWVKNYVNTFQGAKINIQLPDCDYMDEREAEYLSRLVRESEKYVRWMEPLLPSVFRGDDHPPQKTAAPFLLPFFANPCALIDRLLSPRKLFCLHIGDAVWACAHHCTHSHYDRLHVDPRECLLNPPKFTPPVRPPKKARQALKGTSKDRAINAGVQRSVASPRRKDKSLLPQVLTRIVFRDDGSSGPCSMTPKGGEHKPHFSAMIEALSRCRNLRYEEDEEDPFIGFQLLIYTYIHDFAESMPGPYFWDGFIGHIPDDLLWFGDVFPPLVSIFDNFSGTSGTSISNYWICDYMMSWLHWLGKKAFLGSHWSFNEPLTSRCDANPAKTEPRGPQYLFEDPLGKQPRGFEIKCAHYNKPMIRLTSPEDPDPDPEADCLFAALREAGVTGRPTFLGAGLDEPWNYDPPSMRGSQPCYIYDKSGDLMGRGIVDSPLWFLEEREKIEAKEQQDMEQHRRRGGKDTLKLRNRRIVTLAFIRRESLELRAADVLLLPLALPWETETVSCTSATCPEHSRSFSAADRVALEVNNGLTLLTSSGRAGGDGESGSEEEEDDEDIDTDLYDRVGVFEVYGGKLTNERAKQIYFR